LYRHAYSFILPRSLLFTSTNQWLSFPYPRWVLRTHTLLLEQTSLPADLSRRNAATTDARVPPIHAKRPVVRLFRNLDDHKCGTIKRFIHFSPLASSSRKP
jgi:hypothetical protein